LEEDWVTGGCLLFGLLGADGKGGLGCKLYEEAVGPFKAKSSDKDSLTHWDHSTYFDQVSRPGGSSVAALARRTAEGGRRRWARVT